MNRILFAIALCCLLYSCGGGSGKNGSSSSNETSKIESDLQKERISGNVTSVRQRVYWSLEKFGRIEKGKLQNMSRQDFLKTYDKDGFLTEETHYDATDNIVSRQTWAYTNSHLPKKTVSYKGNNELTDSTVYSYNDRGKLVKMEKFNAEGKSVTRNEYTYYEDTGLLMDEDIYQNDKLNLKYVHIYQGGKLIEKQRYWGGGSLAGKEYFRYAGNYTTEVRAEKYQNKDASFVSHTEYANFTEFGDYELKIGYDESGNERTKIEYMYDQYGNLTEYTPFAMHSKEFVATESYDEYVEDDSEAEGEDDGNKAIEVTEVDTPQVGTIEYWTPEIGDAYTYEYDDHKNWTTKITYKVDQSKEERTRQFFYERIITYR